MIQSGFTYQPSSATKSPEFPSIERSYFEERAVDANLSGGACVTFTFPKSEAYSCLKSSFMSCELSVTKEDGTGPLKEEDIVFLKSCPLDLAFRAGQVIFNSTVIASMPEMHVTCTLLNLLGTSELERSEVTSSVSGESVLSCTSSNIKVLEPLLFSDQRDLLKDGKSRRFFGRLRCDLFMTVSQAVPNGTEITVSLELAPSRFVLGATFDDKNYRLKFHRFSFHLHRVHLNSQAQSRIENSLSNGGCLTYRKLDVCSRTVSKGDGQVSWQNVFSGLSLPRMFFVAFMHVSTYQGSSYRLPYFETADVAQVSAFIDGVPLAASGSSYNLHYKYGPDGVILPKQSDANEAYTGLLSVLGKSSWSTNLPNLSISGSLFNTAVPNAVSWRRFVCGATVYAFRSPFSESSHIHSGNADVSVRFRSPPKTPIQCLVISQRNVAVSFTKDRVFSSAHHEI